jgi:hypothetical protein
MSLPSEREAITLVVDRLSELIGRRATRVAADGKGAEARIAFPGRTFTAVWRAGSSVAAVASGLRALESSGHAIPLLAVPHMGEAGRALCEAGGVAWLDLSGNACVEAPGLRVVIEGKPNLFKRVGRPNTPFAPKSARIARWLLLHPTEPTSQRDLAAATGIDAGFTSRIVHRLIDDHLLERAPDGRVFAPRPALLLDAWAELYRFDRHRIRKGVVAARSGTELADRLAEGLVRSGADHAFTGLVAAWQYTRFATYRVATVYLPAGAPATLLSDLGVREGEQGANTWLVVPNDPGVLLGVTDVDGLACVHPVQAWLDLRAHAERAKEAAERLRAERMAAIDA